MVCNRTVDFRNMEMKIGISNYSISWNADIKTTLEGLLIERLINKLLSGKTSIEVYKVKFSISYNYLR